MRTKTIARWRRAALAGALAVSLSVGAQQEQQPEQQPGVEAASANAPPEEQPQAAAEPPPPAAAPDLEVVNKNSREMNSNAVSVSGKLTFTPPPVVTVRASGLVSPEELAESGSIAASFEEREMLSTYDTAYVKFRGEAPAKPGDKLILFRPDGVITHPITHRKIADQTKTVGIVKVLTI